MKVEIWYDAVAQESDVAINEVAVARHDIFGFLYPIRNYPLQTWLYADGSWQGLEYQLLTLAREDIVELIFHGRKIDYDDMKKCFNHHSQIKLQFDEWDVCKEYETLFQNLKNKVERIENKIKEQLNNLHIKTINKVDWNENALENNLNWCCHIYNELDLLEADDNCNKKCCYVHDTFFTSYDKLKEIQRLTRSLKMSSDAIYCCFEQKEKKENYLYYASSVPRMNFHFCLESDDYKKVSEYKYGLPTNIKLNIHNYTIWLNQLCKEYKKLLGEMKKEYTILAKKVVTLNEMEKQKFQNLRQLCGTLELFIEGIKHICEYKDILFSVEKGNKEEALHYQCIDILNKKIENYLEESYEVVEDE